MKTFQAFGCFGTTALTAVTAQNTLGVLDLDGVRPDLVAGQLRAVLQDLPVAAAKTGMLFSRDIIASVQEVWTDLVGTGGTTQVPLVIDPVMVSTSGDRLLLPEAEESLRGFLRSGTIVTPNLAEAAVLLGLDQTALQDLSDMEQAARRLCEVFGTAFLIKGGHRGAGATEAVDVLCLRGKIVHFRAPLLAARHTHGTGCTLSAAIAAGLAHGQDLPRAVTEAKEYVSGAIANAPRLGQGNGPLNHMWRES